jgi:cell pole-organizing protein PopZ
MGSPNLKVNEPSMEDILASIRRIIADDMEPVHEPEVRASAPTPLKSVLDIAESHMSPVRFGEGAATEEMAASEADSFQEEHSVSILMVNYETEHQAAQVPIRPTSQIPVHPCERNPSEALLSNGVGASVSEAFGRLNSVAPAAAQPKSVEDLMTELLRPMLKTWLDENLPALVERLVQAEIERVTRGRP